MTVEFISHALERMAERGADAAEGIATITGGERFPALFGRTGFRRNFRFEATWRGRVYGTKQIEAYAVEEGFVWLVITVIVRYF